MFYLSCQLDFILCSSLLHISLVHVLCNINAFTVICYKTYALLRALHPLCCQVYFLLGASQSEWHTLVDMHPVIIKCARTSIHAELFFDPLTIVICCFLASGGYCMTAVSWGPHIYSSFKLILSLANWSVMRSDSGCILRWKSHSGRVYLHLRASDIFGQGCFHAP